MIDLDDAWTWYVTTRNQLKLFGRLGLKHWDGLPWDGTLGKDDKMRSSTAAFTACFKCLKGSTRTSLSKSIKYEGIAIGSRTDAAPGSPTPSIPRRLSDD